MRASSARGPSDAILQRGLHGAHALGFIMRTFLPAVVACLALAFLVSGWLIATARQPARIRPRRLHRHPLRLLRPETRDRRSVDRQRRSGETRAANRVPQGCQDQKAGGCATHAYVKDAWSLPDRPRISVWE